MVAGMGWALDDRARSRAVIIPGPGPAPVMRRKRSFEKTYPGLHAHLKPLEDASEEAAGSRAATGGSFGHAPIGVSSTSRN